VAIKGYDNRETTRRTFAFTPPAARQVNSASAPTSGRTGVVGAGENTSGVVQSQNPTISIGVGSSVPGFLDKLLEPVVKQAQEKRMREGYALASDGIAMERIAAEQPGLTAIFGPTDFQVGAAAFTVQDSANKYQNQLLENMDELKQVPPDQLPSLLEDMTGEYLTGDTFTDNALHGEILQRQATLIPAIAEARTVWQQTTLRRGFVSGAVGAGAALKNTMTTAELPDEVRSLARQQFLESFTPLEGMHDAAWQDGIGEAARGVLADGNLFAYRAMADGGNDSLLYHAMDADKLGAIQSAADTASRKALTDWSLDNGELIDTLNAQIITRELKGDEIRDVMEGVNLKAERDTGSTVPLFSADDINNAVKGYVRDVHEDDVREQERQFQYSISPTNPANIAAAADAKLNDIRMGLASGDPTTVIAKYGMQDVDNSLRQWWQQDPAQAVGLMTRMNQQRGYTFSGTAQDIQAFVTANTLAGADGESFQKIYKVWQAFGQQENGGIVARATYFGDHDRTFLRYSQLTSNGTPQVLAFTQTFGDPGSQAGTMGRAPRPQGTRGQEIAQQVTRLRPAWYARMVGATGPDTASQETILQLAGGGASERMTANPRLTVESAVAAEVESLIASKTMDRVGSRYWHTPQRTPRMTDLTRIPEDRLVGVWDQTIQQQKAQHPDIDISSYQVTPAVTGDTGTSVWYVWSQDAQGRPHYFSVTPDMLRNTDRENMRARRPENNRPAILLPGVRGPWD